MVSEHRNPIGGRGFAGLAALGTSISPEPPLPPVPPFQPTKRVEPVARFTEPAPRAIYEEPPPRAFNHGSASGKKRKLRMSARLLWVVLWICAVAIYHIAGDREPAYERNHDEIVEALSSIADRPQPEMELQPTVSMTGGRVYVASEVLYCVAEDFRLRTLEGAINRRSSSEVRQLTDRRADFNSRCLGYRFMQHDLDAATKQVEYQAFDLREQALQDLAGWR